MSAAEWLESRLRRGTQERFSEDIQIGPDLARRLLDLNTQNRGIIRNRIEDYAQMIREGRWKFTIHGIGVRFDRVLGDGQHRLLAVLRCDRPIEKITTTFGCHPDEFTAVDAGRARTGADLLSVDHVRNATIKATIAGAILRIEAGSLAKLFNAQAINEKARELESEEFTVAAAYGAACKRIVAPGASALAYWLILNHSRHAHRLPDFFEQLKTGADLAETNPILKTREWLLNVRNNGGSRGGRSGRDLFFTYTAALMLGWNAWIQNSRRVKLVWEPLLPLPVPV